MDEITSLALEVKEIFQGITKITSETTRNDKNCKEIGYGEIPLSPELLAYCFDVILGFNVRYKIAEKVNYFIEFDYNGTYATVTQRKLSYCINADRKHVTEIIALLNKSKPILEQLFILLGEKALIENDFSMENEASQYLAKMDFYQKRIESLEARATIIKEKCKGQYDTINEFGYKYMTPKGQGYLRNLYNEEIYDIESYIDTFYSALEHILTLLYPFTDNFSLSNSYYKVYIRNTRWTWDCKINDVCGELITKELFEELRKIKEIYRNHNAHGGFSREMMAYVYIPKFGRYPLFVGKEYLKGFTDGAPKQLSYDMYLQAKAVFVKFWEILDTNYTIPMMFIKSELPIPVETNLYTKGITTSEHAQGYIDKTWFDIENQYNMDW
jgi:hypothetical protein